MIMLHSWKYYLSAAILSIIIGFAFYFIVDKVFGIIFWIISVVSFIQMILALRSKK